MDPFSLVLIFPCTSSFLNPISKTLFPSIGSTVINYIYSSKCRSRKGRQESKLESSFQSAYSLLPVPKPSWGFAFFPAWHQEFQYTSRGKWSTTQLCPRLRECNRVTEAMQTYHSQIAKPVPPSSKFSLPQTRCRYHMQSTTKVTYVNRPFFLPQDRWYPHSFVSTFYPRLF